MVAKSIKAKLGKIIFGIALLIAIAISSFFLNRLADYSTWKIQETTKLEKDFFQLVLQEKDGLANQVSLQSIHSNYERFLSKCNTCHDDDKTGVVLQRISIYDRLFHATRDSERQVRRVHVMLSGLKKNIHLIYNYHFSKLPQYKNWSNLGPSTKAPPSMDNALRELEIVRATAEVQTAIFDIVHSFQALLANGATSQIVDGFSKEMSRYFMVVDNFEDLHLIPEDRLAVEELLFQGDKLKISFHGLLKNKEEEQEIVVELESNRHALQSVLEIVRDRLSLENKRNYYVINVLQGVALIFAILIVRWIISHGNSIVRESRKSVSETEKIREDISYRIETDNSEFQEFRVISHALNSMADDIEVKIKELRKAQRETEKKVEERTADLVESNIKLKLEIEERMRMEEEQKDLQAQLRQAQKMEAIGTLAGGIAHDFNNILTAILGFAELAKDELDENNPARRDMDQILLSGARAKDLVKQILAFSRQVDQERLPMQLYLIVKEIVKLLRASLPSTIEIRQDIATQCGSILADPVQIRQLIMNLCTNAAHAMDMDGGILGIDLCGIEFCEDDLAPFPDLEPGKYVKFSVTDTGTGMDLETKERIFDPFFTTKSVNQGTGLGLSVVHGIVEAHDGRIYVESELGKGTSVHIFFPVAEENIALRSEDEPEGAIGGSERIIFVDDENAIVSLADKILSRLGYDVKCFANGIDVLDAFKAAPDDFDLVVTDQTMPDMTGIELAGGLLTLRPDIPIILCSGYSEKINEDRAMEIGIRRFVMKPVMGRELAKIIRKVLDDGQ